MKLFSWETFFDEHNGKETLTRLLSHCSVRAYYCFVLVGCVEKQVLLGQSLCFCLLTLWISLAAGIIVLWGSGGKTAFPRILSGKQLD